jgi:hypothetical protein
MVKQTTLSHRPGSQSFLGFDPVPNHTIDHRENILRESLGRVND